MNNELFKLAMIHTLFRYYLENFAKAGQIGSDGKLEGGKKGGLFYDVRNLSNIWNHPYILLLSKLRKDAKDGINDDELLINDKIDEDEDEDYEIKDVEDSDSDIQEVDMDGEVLKRAARADDVAKLSSTGGWWNHFLQNDQSLDDLTLGSKMVLLMDILKECAMIGDKVLVFSQSILSLDLIEDFLAKVQKAGTPHWTALTLVAS